MGALDELHGQKRPAVRQRAEVVHRRDGGVLELAGNACLVGEPAGHPGAGAVLLLQHLHGDFPAERGIGGAEDDAHAAAGDLITEDETRRPGERNGRLG